MFEYLKFLFTKLKSFDDKLSNIALLQEKFWIRINDNNFSEKWFFRNNGELIISINGNIIDGRYEYLNQGNLILEYEKIKILLNQNFIYKDILLLKKGSNESDFYAFYDETKFTPDQFLKFIETSKKQDLNIKQIQLADKTNAEILMNPNQQIISLGNSVLINQKLTDLNSIETNANFYELQDGIIKNILFKFNYKLFDNDIIVKQKCKTINIEDEIVDSKFPIKNGKYKIGFNIGIEIQNNRISSKFFIIFSETNYKKHNIEIWCRNPKEFSTGDLVIENDKPASDGKYWISLLKSIKVKNGKLE
ncbi:hypothetical protein [Tamlana sp. I1]|uniref:hypothetical protein n=1 Tax=Tamlana sp. I1 TaxID=2762061 RepID=UPI00188F0ED7|nr:hypothetical protein [Tamlana sp. I1]